MPSTTVTRRQFLGAAAVMAAASACGGPAGRGGQPTVVAPSPAPDSSATKLVGDVLDFKLRGAYTWLGGSVTLKLHAAFFNGQKAYFVRTDTSDAAFAKQEGLVYVPLLNGALAAKPIGAGEIYLFDGAAAGQLPVISTAPGAPDFTSLFIVQRVRGAGAVLDSVEKLRAAQRSGSVTVESTRVVVNYPVVKWPTGELPVDAKVEKALEGGPLLAKPDTDRLTVTFKLHQCFPESRYIVTDTSAVPMAPMMNVAGAPATAGLIASGATSKITVFGNGLKGPGAMGFQPAIFQAKAGDAAWSPMWDHWTAMWMEPARATLLRTQDELDARVRAGDVQLFHGTPDTKGEGFVVNCPSPLVAPNDFIVR
ncbi:MAG TPA: twin-arginine translocation signal domain-containing protein [Candidatus Limnocylindria bacterium]|nr:twin-arginine translocation signal domain-containing protein [Candidatus Limnocylindria bacterium]